MKALRVNVYKSGRGDCTNNGVSNRYNELLVLCYDGNVEVNGDEPNLCMVDTIHIGMMTTYHIEPMKKPDKGCVGWMMGGNYAASSDGRFARLVGGMYGAVAIHDRQETTEDYDMYSR